MTTVRALIQTPAAGSPEPAVGELRWKPTARRVVPANGDVPAAVILPEAFPVKLQDGAATFDLDPSTDAWVWTVVESFVGLPSRRRYLVVPDQGSVDYADLVEIDPVTLTPAPSLDPAWAAPLEEVRAGTVSPDPDHPGFYLIGA
ncbi:hypothetical protein PBI_JUDY_29 [Arthrobacter phage Judy]|uniref:Uncharacterized protein n=1 Tax=Arthrobacter phage Judy TaxID=2419958 RepID=A0A3G2KGJ2_9CAUD|nr:minor tail protein [Arthrobacter phage Judy]AYN58099.1 hypothetical protein PBI_JUDY_29 [Arthrobacter phage Judy]